MSRLAFSADQQAAWHAARLRPGFGGLRVHGIYTAAGQPRQLQKVELACIPMAEPHEYASVALFERPHAAPVLMSPTQRYAVLTALVKDLRASVPDIGFIGIRLYGSDFDVQLSAELLAPDVLITQAPLQLLPCLLQAGRQNVVVVHHDLRADGLEQGHNEFAVWLVAPTTEAIDGFARFAAGNAFLQSLSGLQADTFDMAQVHGVEASS